MKECPFFRFTGTKRRLGSFVPSEVEIILPSKGCKGAMGQSGKSIKRESVIDENLKKVYEETLQEGVPDRFLVLLDALKKQETAQGNKR
jgi:hypothetical protein